MELGGAKPGDRTMLDALVPASEAFASALHAGSAWADALRMAQAAAEAGSKAAASMSPRKGRSSYLGDRALGHPDPGAEAVAVWLRAIAATSA
jgi:dihydroxyacetone kinase